MEAIMPHVPFDGWSDAAFKAGADDAGIDIARALTFPGGMAEVLASPAWQTPLPVPTVDRTDKRWKSNAFWRGDVWPPTNYQIAGGLAAYGHTDLAAGICDKTIANAIKNGISEHYDSVTGKALGVPDYCMSSTLVTMMLDGLAKEHRLKVRRSSRE